MYEIGSIKRSKIIDEIILWVIMYIFIFDDEILFFRNLVKVKVVNVYDNRKKMCWIDVFINLDNSKFFLFKFEEMYDSELCLGKFDLLVLDNNKLIVNKENFIIGGERNWFVFVIVLIVWLGDDVLVVEKLLVFLLFILNIKFDERILMEVKMLIKII